MAVAMAASAAADNDLPRFDAAMQDVLQGPLSQMEQDRLIALLLQAEEEEHFNVHMDEEQHVSAASASASTTAPLGSRTYLCFTPCVALPVLMPHCVYTANHISSWFFFIFCWTL